MNVNKAKLFPIPARMDEREFEAVFSEHYARVYAILYRMTGDSLEADDLATETFWRLWERPPAQMANLSGWIYRVAMRLGYNLLRSKRRRSVYEERAGKAILIGNEPPDPAVEAEQAIERKRVRETLQSMPERDAQIILLRHSGLSYKEIAAVLSIAPTSVGTLLARAEDRFENIYRRGS